MGDSETYKTKDSNTFRYKSFADRVNEIDLRHLTFYHIGHKNEELPEEVYETYFHQTLKKWMVLNLSEEFSIFCRKVIKIVSLPQLLYKKEFVIETILDHIAVATNLSLQSLLELLYILAKDLREEFYPYFQRILNCIIPLFNTQDADQLEWILTCFAYICKLLKTYLKRNIGLIFYNILPLLDEQRYNVHINNFAVECFSFIARDVKDFSKFLDYLLNTLITEDNKGKVSHYVQACGRLLFEIIRGIKGQFHSSAEDFLEFLFEKLSTIGDSEDNKNRIQLLNDIVYQTMDNILKFISPSHITVLWQKLCLVTNNINNPIQFENLIKLYQQIASYKNGKYLTDMDIIVPTITQIVDKTMTTITTVKMTILNMMIHLISTVVMCGISNSKFSSNTCAGLKLVTQLDTSRLLKKALTIKERPLYEEFIRLLIHHPQFDIFLLPSLAEYFEEYFDTRAFKLMSEVILRRFPLQFHALQTEQENIKEHKEGEEHPCHKWNIKLKRNETLNKIENKLSVLQEEINVECHLDEDQLLLLSIVQHLKDFPTQKILNILNKIQCRLLHKIKQQQKQQNDEKIVKGQINGEQSDYIDLLILITAMQHSLKYCSLDDDRLNDIIEVLLQQDQGHHLELRNAKILSCLNQLVARNAKCIRKTDNLLNYLTNLLAYRDYEMQLLASHSLWHLNNNNNSNKLYEIFYKTLNIETNVHTFREQLVYIKQLHIDGELFKSFRRNVDANDFDNDSNHCKEHCVHFLLGLLYRNFKDLWEPVQKLLQEYCQEIDSNKFWNIYYRKMQETNEVIEMHKQDNIEPLISKTSSVCKRLIPLKVLETFFSYHIQDGNRNDKSISLQHLYNYRILLWQSLIHFGKVLEMKNRDIVNMFFTFLQNEYYKQQQVNDTKNQWTWNLLQKCNDECNDLEFSVGTEEAIEEDEWIDEINVSGSEHHNKQKEITINLNKNKNKTKLNCAKILMKTMQAKLSVLSSFNNPKALYRERELWELYMQLIMGNNIILQKSALDCIMAYKIKAIITYKEHLYNMLDEKKFRNELINFKINEIVQEECRSTFQEIFLRLLYGKMLTKGNKKGISSQQRKSIILRFMGDCQLKEIEWFTAMAFMPYKDYLNEYVNILDIPVLVKANFQCHMVWSGNKLQSSLNLWELLRKEFGGRMHKDFHVYMLKLLIFIGSVCQMVLQNTLISSVASRMQSKILVVYRNVKQNCLQCLLNFFIHLDNFQWSDDIINCLTDIFVYPHLEKLTQDSLQTPTVLLKLLLQWGNKPEHFGFLLQKQTDHTPTIFSYIIKLLLNEKIKSTVRKCIMAMVECILEVYNNKNKFQIEDVHAKNVLALIEPHIPELLKYLKGRLQIRQKGKLLLDKQDLNILSMLTKLVNDPHICDQLLQLLLPILLNKCQGNATTETINQIIHTLINLMKQLERPELYIRRLAPFYEHLQEVMARKDLCNLITNIVRLRAKYIPNSNELITIGRIILLLNAWDKRWVEQPDYNKRLQGFQEMVRLMNEIDNDGVSMDLGVLVIYNCFHFLRYDKDLALRDNASEQLRLLFPYLAQKFCQNIEDLDYLMNNVFMPFISQTIRGNQENIRNEGIRLLSVMVRTSPNCHVILKDLYPLADCKGVHSVIDNDDMENDFFENLTHLQIYKHGRALLKFCNYASTLTEPLHTMTLTKFLLPLTSHYLLKEQYAGNHTLIDAAIDAIGIICQFMPWQQYHAILKYYLMKLRTNHDFQKQCVRIVTRILDAFHYNLHLDDLEELSVIGKNINDIDGKEQHHIDEKDVTKKKNKESENDITEYNVMMDSFVKDKEGQEEEGTSDEELDSKLSNVDNMNIENEHKKREEKSTHSKLTKPYLSELQTLSVNASKKILHSISRVLIPTLNRCITENTSFESKHKLNRKRLNAEREEEEILRVPIALALIKLMQKLPKNILDNNLPGVFTKVCTFLRSPLISVRRYTRDILKKILLCLGSEYLGQLMEYLQALLTRGFQVHVLSVTVYGILETVRNKLEPEHLESCMSNVLEVALNDIFGEINAEKDIIKLHNHTPEAKPSAKSYLVLQIVASNIREKCFLDLLMPLREYLTQSKSRKLIVKIQECFSKIVSGLVENNHLPRESLLIFIHGTISESIQDLLPGTERKMLSEKEKEKMRRSRPDCFIIPAEPGRRSIYTSNKNVKTNIQVNAHILIEFGLELLHNVLKRKKLHNFDYEPFLNPLMPLLRDSLKSSHVRVIVFTLKCFILLWIEDYKLTSLEDIDNMKIVVERLFDLLKNFSNFGVTKQDDNSQLIQTTFKAVVAILHKCDYYRFTDEQIDQLTLYIEQDLQEVDNQTNIIFNLIEALLQRKINTRPMHDIMKTIRDISIISQSDYIRNKARAMLIVYVMECCQYRKIEQIVKDISVQLLYVTPAGRLSAIEFFDTIIRKFPLNILSKFASFLYLSLATRLINDIDPECRKAVALCIETLLKRLDKVTRQSLFNMTLQFFKDDYKSGIREMAAALCSRFVNAEKEKFSKRLKIIFPLIIGRLISNPNSPGRFVRSRWITSNNDQGNTAKKFKKFSQEPLENILLNATQDQVVKPEIGSEMLQQQELDHELLQLQYCLLKIFENCSEELLHNCSELNEMIDELAYECQRLLAHDHAGVRSNSIKLLTYILSSLDFDIIGAKLREHSRCEGEVKKVHQTHLNFIYYDPEYDIKALVLDLCAQVVPGDLQTAAIMEDICKIFLFVATILKDIPFTIKKIRINKSNADEEEQEGENIEETLNLENSSCLTKINLNWLMRNIRYLINKEVTKANNSIIIRHALFILMEGLITLLSEEMVNLLASTILMILIREMSEDDQNIDPNLRQLALRVGSRLRQKIGIELYSKKKIDAEAKLKERRAERKRILIQEKVHDPERAAKRHASIQQRKKLAKKSKIDLMRGKLSDLNDTIKLRKLKKRQRAG